MEDHHRQEGGPLIPDPLRRARILLILLSGMTVAGLAVLLPWLWWTQHSAQAKICRALVSDLGLSTPAWTPSGHPSRQPEPLYHNVDLRPSAAFPPFDPSTEILLIEPPRRLGRDGGSAPNPAQAPNEQGP